MATPAEPILASVLWEAQLTSNKSVASLTTATKVACGNRRIDTALEGGLEYGSIHCISGDSDSGTRSLSQAFLVSHLLSSSAASASVIDSALALDVRKLHSAIMLRQGSENGSPESAAKILDRVQIMKVFDFVGMTESLTEIRHVLEGREPAPATVAVQAKYGAPKSTVGDSEDEDEMLDVPTPILPPVLKAPIDPSSLPSSKEHHLMVIDNITQVTTPLLKNNYVQGQAVLSSFMRSLGHLTKTHGICTIIFNGIAPNYNVRDDTPSVFSSCSLQPALGRTFTYMLDTHLLIHRVPRTADRQSQRSQRPGLEDEISIVEVLQDERGSRVGKWASFTTHEATDSLQEVA